MNRLPESQHSPEQLEQQRKARLIMLAIVAAFVLPFVVLPLFSSPHLVGKTNKGALIEPHIPLAELGLVQQDGAPVDLASLEGRWSLLYAVPISCEGPCQKARNHALYAMRQVRRSLDRDVDRVQSLVVLPTSPDESLATLLASEFAEMRQLRGNPEIPRTALPGQTPPAGYIFLVSPDGYVFMAYPTFSDEQESVLRARDIRADLKKTLKGERHF